MASICVHIQLICVLCHASMSSAFMPPKWSHGRLYMIGALMQERATQNVYQCENLCRVTKPCLSVDYGYATKLCSLYRDTPVDTDISPSRTHVYTRDLTSNTEIKCRQNTCPDGKVCAANGKQTLCLLAGISCGPVPEVLNSLASSDDTSYGSEISYSCNKGYAFQGSNQMAWCSEDGSWTGFEGSCDIITCETPPDMDNAAVTYSDTTYDSTATYTCHTGYEFSGANPNTTCGETGWSSVGGECTIITCGTPPELTSVEVTYDTMTYAAMATYSCNLGYEFIGETHMSTCTETGSWTVVDGNCSIITCELPPDLPNAEVTFSTTTYGSLATYTCLLGFEFDGDNPNITCTERSSWSILSGNCTLISCGEPPEVVNMTVTYQAMTYGSLATYSCSEGYRLLGGTPDVSCNETGSWDNQTGACYRYMGCYTDDWRRLFDDKKSTLSQMTLLSCFDFCKNFKFAGAQNRQECYCGNEIDETLFPKTEETECNSPCSGDSSQICGASWRSSVYKL